MAWREACWPTASCRHRDNSCTYDGGRSWPKAGLLAGLDMHARPTRPWLPRSSLAPRGCRDWGPGNGGISRARRAPPRQGFASYAARLSTVARGSSVSERVSVPPAGRHGRSNTGLKGFDPAADVRMPLSPCPSPSSNVPWPAAFERRATGDQIQHLVSVGVLVLLRLHNASNRHASACHIRKAPPGLPPRPLGLLTAPSRNQTSS